MATPDEMRKEFHKLAADRAEAVAKAKSLREKYEQLRAQEHAVSAQIKAMLPELKAAEAPLYEIDNARGALSRALNGQTGKP